MQEESLKTLKNRLECLKLKKEILELEETLKPKEHHSWLYKLLHPDYGKGPSL